MTLTGKASALFYSWIHQGFDYEPSRKAILASDWFNSLHPSMQWGVYQDWADSIKFELRVTVNHGSGWYDVLINIPEYWNSYPTRQEARNAAIEKLNELINKEQ